MLRKLAQILTSTKCWVFGIFVYFYFINRLSERSLLIAAVAFMGLKVAEDLGRQHLNNNSIRK